MLQMGNDRSLLTGLCALAIAMGLNFSTAQAQDADRFPPPLAGAFLTATPEVAAPIRISHLIVRANPQTYFVEFRARSAHSYGHTFLVHGKAGQKITAKDVVGLHPASESPVPWMIGHLVPVVSETGASDGDFEDEYVIARYRIGLTEAEYKKTLATMRKMQSDHPVWHAVLYNCNRFVGDVAETMGLKAPSNSLLMPKDFINTLKEMNGARADLSGSNSAPKQTASASAPKRQQTASASSKRQPAAEPASARQEASVRPQVNEYQQPEN